MQELVRSTDPVLLSRLEVLLREAEILVFRFDSHISGVEGGIGIFPQRLMVGDDDLEQARRLIRAENLGWALYEKN